MKTHMNKLLAIYGIFLVHANVPFPLMGHSVNMGHSPWEEV